MDYSQYPRNDILCIDIRSFYASVEALKLGLDPMKEMVAVVGDPNRSGSIVLAASPMLKQTHGISNVSRFFDLPDDPEIYIVQAHMQDYLDVSIEITKLLYKYAPKEAIHTYSVDEMWITTNGLEQLFGNRLEVAQRIKEEILHCFGLTCSIGIGDNKFLAKVVMDLHAKKKGIAECTYEDVPALLWPSPIQKIWGIGSRMTRNLNNLGMYTLKDLAMYDKEKLKDIYGVMGEQLYWHAWGVDLSPVFGDFIHTERKSFSNGITLLRDYTFADVKICMLDLVEEVCWRARSKHMSGRTISVSIGYSEDRGGFSRSTSINTHTNSTRDMYEQCLKL
ncbi:MAG TPA: UV damage repair protein UvrX, partial [Bacillota bacterium]|nr:UV damage repair protein UvrX [Bacillota bacterium]